MALLSPKVKPTMLLDIFADIFTRKLLVRPTVFGSYLSHLSISGSFAILKPLMPLVCFVVVFGFLGRQQRVTTVNKRMSLHAPLNSFFFETLPGLCPPTAVQANCEQYKQEKSTKNRTSDNEVQKTHWKKNRVSTPRFNVMREYLRE